MNRVKAALIGYGYWGRILKKYMDASNCFDIVMIYKRNIEEKEDGFTSDLEEIINNESIKAAVVCTPSYSHYNIVKELLQHNKHVLCEKPLVMCQGQAEELFLLAERKNKVLFTDYIYLYSDSIRKAKELIGQIEPVYFFEGEISQWGNFYKDETAIDVLGVHMFSVIAYFFSAPFDIESCLDEKGLGIVSMRNKNLQAILKCSLIGEDKKRKFCIYGKNGTIEIDMLGQEWTVRKREMKNNDLKYALLSETIYFFDEMNNLKQLIDSYARAISQNECQLNRKVSITVHKYLMAIKKKNRKESDV